MTETVSGLLTQKPERPPEVGQIKCFTVEKRTSKKGKGYYKIKNSTVEMGGQSYKILKAEQTDYEDDYGNVSYNVEIEATTEGPANAPESPPVRQNQSNGDEIAKFCAYSRKVFEHAWVEAENWIRVLPEKDAQDLSVADYLDLKMRVAQHIAIECAKIIRKERF